MNGMELVFHDPEGPRWETTPVKAAQQADDGHSTSTKRVDGFKDGFKHPSLWTAQDGKVLQFDGTYK